MNNFVIFYNYTSDQNCSMFIMLIHSGVEPDHWIDCSLSPSDTSLPQRVLSYRHYLIMKGFATQGIGYIHNEFVIERKVRIGFEPMNERFAVTCLTTWLPNLIVFLVLVLMSMKSSCYHNQQLLLISVFLLLSSFKLMRTFFYSKIMVIIGYGRLVLH